MNEGVRAARGNYNGPHELLRVPWGGIKKKPALGRSPRQAGRQADGRTDGNTDEAMDGRTGGPRNEQASFAPQGFPNAQVRSPLSLASHL